MAKKEVDFALSTRNWKDICFDKYNQDFTFIVDGKRYQTPRFVADIISPKIRNLHYIDESFNEFHIKTNNINKSEDHFPDFLKLCMLDKQKLDSSRIHEYSSYFKELGNIGEYFHLEFSTIEALTTEKAISFLSQINSLFDKSTENFDTSNEQIKEIISFISSHFYELSETDIRVLGKDMIEMIISNEELKINDEDSLFEIIMKLYEEDETYSNLFGRVIFCNLSSKSVEKFVNTFSFDDISSEIWSSICMRLLKSKEVTEKVIIDGRYLKPMMSKKEFKVEKGHELEGIMRHLTNETNGNIHDNGTIEITTNSIYGDNIKSYHPKNLVDYQNSSSLYYSKNEPGVFVCFDFKDRRIQLSSYSIQTQSGSPNACHLKNWVIEVSNDNKSWEEVDCRSNDSTLNGSSIIGVFNIKKQSSEFYQYIRLRQTDVCWYNDYRIYIPFIEFFGKMEEPSKNN